MGSYNNGVRLARLLLWCFGLSQAETENGYVEGSR